MARKTKSKGKIRSSLDISIPAKKNVKIGVVDTTFARVNMGGIAVDELKRYPEVTYVRRTVPGIKDLAVECKRLLELEKCDILLALGMVGSMPIDEQCAHEASLAIQQAKLATNRHIIEVFVHEGEAWSPKELYGIFQNRVRKHTHNAVALSQGNSLEHNAGRGIRQGTENEGELRPFVSRHSVVIAVAEFNREITEVMERHAMRYLENKRCNVKVVHAPGTYDLPLILKKELSSKTWDGAIALGAIVKGDTLHDEVIANACAQGIISLSLKTKKPIAFGVIGPGATYEHASSRAEEYAIRACDSVLTTIERLKG